MPLREDGRMGGAAGVDLILTGERTLPGIEHENYWFRRHEAAYLALAPFAVGATVLEAGSGEGYGAQLLRGVARSVTAVELDPAAAAHAAAAYPGLRVLRADRQRLPLRRGSVEVVDQAGFVDECARVLRAAGTLLLTTPNEATFPPGNPFHTRELRMAELEDLLAPHFDVVRRWGVRHGRALRWWEWRKGGLAEAQLDGPPADWPPAVRRRVQTVSAASFEVGPFREDDLDLAVVAVRRAP